MTPDSELHPIAFHSQTFSAPELNYDVHNKELLCNFWSFNDGDIMKALDFRLMWSPITRICNTFSMTKNTHNIDKHIGLNIFPVSTW